ncbi:MAG: DNA polymerase III subunit gamma/tau [Firmicutes bacterium]|nr:DNA polymerase III subunit gamma/tau [Bacillota bacterium]
MNQSINSLYRKYRPTKFSEIVGQQHIVKTLQNQIKNDSVNHAYLFYGTRGTGKTTIAKILARSLAEPTDIFELDAASYNSVDNVREIIEKTKYPPSFSKYKVYIIDEVHMFSGAAFNAFLKTLEEPPSHIIFILCTTEPHKLPQTILSRVLRFDFRPISNIELEKHLAGILKKEGIEYEDSAIKMIINEGRGSVRDSLSLAESVLAFDKKVTQVNVEQVLGKVNSGTIQALIKSVLEKNIDQTMKTTEQILSGGNNVISILQDVLREIKSEFIKTKNNELVKIYKIFADIEMNLKTSVDPKTMFEGACLIAIAG